MRQDKAIKAVRRNDVDLQHLAQRIAGCVVNLIVSELGGIVQKHNLGCVFSARQPARFLWTPKN